MSFFGLELSFLDVVRAASPREEKPRERGATIAVPGSRLGMLSQASRHAQQRATLSSCGLSITQRRRNGHVCTISSLKSCRRCRFVPQGRGSRERRRTREAELGQDRTPHAFAAHLHSSATSVFDRKLAPPSYAHTAASLNGDRLLNICPRSWVSRRPGLSCI